jgi:hypothetical protein
MAILTNFPLDCNDQVSVIEIFDGLMRGRDDGASSMEAAQRKPNSSLPLPDPEFQRPPSAPSE